MITCDTKWLLLLFFSQFCCFLRDNNTNCLYYFRFLYLQWGFIFGYFRCICACIPRNFDRKLYVIVGKFNAHQSTNTHVVTSNDQYNDRIFFFFWVNLLLLSLNLCFECFVDRFVHTRIHSCVCVFFNASVSYLVVNFQFVRLHTSERKRKVSYSLVNGFDKMLRCLQYTNTPDEIALPNR